jgi:hypothetical protein
MLRYATILLSNLNNIAVFSPRCAPVQPEFTSRRVGGSMRLGALPKNEGSRDDHFVAQSRPSRWA